MGTPEEYRHSTDLDIWYVIYVIGKPLISGLSLCTFLRGLEPLRVPNQGSNMLLPLQTCTVGALTQVKMMKPNLTCKLLAKQFIFTFLCRYSSGKPIHPRFLNLGHRSNTNTNYSKGIKEIILTSNLYSLKNLQIVFYVFENPNFNLKALLLQLIITKEAQFNKHWFGWFVWFGSHIDWDWDRIEKYTKN